ncbi:phage tail protein I [Bacillus infantis]|uniref:phage tail protein I n=1 Tax=Bacillus infantis TaxID=324767 RepID=UPI00321B7BC5
MINLDNFSLAAILPSSLVQNDEDRAMAEAITAMLKDVYQKTSLLDFSILPEALLDILAYEEHVDFYDPTLTIEQKRELIERSYFFHRKKGTPAAVEQLIEIVFGEGRVEEWFEYGGEPGYFKVVTSNTAVTQELAEQFIRALDSVKRKSAWLEKVEISQTESMPLFFGGVAHIGKKYTLKQVY